METDTRHRIEIYLSRLRARLGGMNAENIRDIVEELRGHIIDKAAAKGDVTASGVDAVLAALGSPEELASQYMTDELLARAEVSRSPLSILRALLRWSSLNVLGFFVLLGSTLPPRVQFDAVRAIETIPSQSAGLWASRDSTGGRLFSIGLGFGSAPASGRDVLGWWIVPIGLLVGAGLVMSTTRIALWCLRLYRRSRVLPHSQQPQRKRTRNESIARVIET